jgi:hypothetical protein
VRDAHRCRWIRGDLHRSTLPRHPWVFTTLSGGVRGLARLGRGLAPPWLAVPPLLPPRSSPGTPPLPLLLPLHPYSFLIYAYCTHAFIAAKLLCCYAAVLAILLCMLCSTPKPPDDIPMPTGSLCCAHPMCSCICVVQFLTGPCSYAYWLIHMLTELVIGLG